MNIRARLLCLLLIVALALPVTATYIPPTTTTIPLVRVTYRPIVPVATTTTTGIGAIEIASVPSGASVAIDGTTMGTTPYTIRTLPAGSHTLVLQLAGYQDYSTSFAITAGTLNRQTYTLAPVTTATTVRTTVTTQAPVRIVTPVAVPTLTTTPSLNLTAQYRFPRPASIIPITITVGNHTKTPRLTTLSPYFSAQLSAPANSAGTWHVPDLTTTPTSYIEIDSHNVYLPGSHVMSSVEMANDPVWGDNDTIPIAIADRFFNNTNFRWISATNGATAFYQISRYPFDSNASHWQNQYVPGLVSSGPVKDIHVDSEGFHYFSINFAPVANHNPADPPFYTGLAHLDQTVPGRGTPMGMVKIPVIGVGIYTRKAVLGPLSIPVPAAVTMIPAGELTEPDLGNPNQNMILSSSDTVPSSLLTSVETSLLDMPQTYYVRVVPINSDGTAGVPTIPVTVTVVRPKPCPPNPPSDVENEITVKPPSAAIASFYMTSFVPDWIHTNDQGALVSRAHFVTVSEPPYCNATLSPSGSGMGMITEQYGPDSPLCQMYGGAWPGYHFYADPEESHWYDTVWDVITGLFSAFTEVIHAVSSAWNEIQALAAQVVAYAIQGLTFGQFDCSGSPPCMAVISTGISVAEGALGIPPTLPDVSDLESMGADYMAKVAADEVGAGGALDAAKDVYNSLPDNVQGDIKQNAPEVGSDIASAVVSQTGQATASAAGSFYIPDPLYYQAHPATVMVKVTNPNSDTTDPVTLIVSDSSELYKASHGMYVPPLKPGDSTVIPVVLEEDYSKVYTADCNADQYTTECGDICVPCYWNLWYFAVINSSKNGGDTFSVTMTNKTRGIYMTLTPSSSGTVLSNQNILNFDEQGKSCGSYTVKTTLRYPNGWKMQNTPLNQDLWSLCWLKYSFTNGESGRLIGG